RSRKPIERSRTGLASAKSQARCGSGGNYSARVSRPRAGLTNPHSMKKLLAFIVLILLAAAAAAAAWVFVGTRQRYRGFSTPEQFVDIRPGTRTRAIGEQLVGAGVVRDHLTFRAALW